MAKKSRLRDYFTMGVPAIIVVIVGFIFAYQFVGPPPPKVIRIAAGRSDGAYYGFAKEYATRLAKEGITLEVIETAGTMENITLLNESDSTVDIALVQSGVIDASTSDQLHALGSLYLEPLWIFLGREVDVGGELSGLQGKRIAIGAEGSGTRPLAVKILTENGISEENSSYLSLAGKDASNALQKGQVDAVFLVSSPDSQVVKKLVGDPSISLFSCARADAYVRRFPFLSKVTLPAGIFDFRPSLPAKDIVLLAPAATFVSQKTLHPALIDLLLQAANEVHGKAGILAENDQLPSPLYCDLPLSKDATRYFKYGPPFLQRYLPFWLATLVVRLKVMLVPMIILLLPLFKVIPPIFQWKTRRKVVKWYNRLQEIDLDSQATTDQDKLRTLADEITQIDHDVSRVSIPLGYADQLYSLRLHINMVADKIRAAREKVKTSAK